MLLSYLAGTLSVFIWALLPVLVKSSFKELPISYFLILRFSFSTLFVGLVMWKLWSQILKIHWQQHLQFALILGLNYGLQSLAIKDLPVSWYIVIFALNPIIALLLMKVRMSRALIMSLTLGILGVGFFVFFEDQVWQSITWKSFFYMFGGMLTWVFYTLRAKSIQKFVSDSALTLYTQVISFLAILIIWILDSAPMVPLESLSWLSWFSILLSGFGLPVAYYLYLYSLRRTPVFCQMSQYLELIFGLLFSWFIYHEELNQYKFIGTSLILFSLYLTTRIPTQR